MSQKKLNQVADWYSSYQGLNGYMILCLFQKFKKHIKSPLLEIGAADGYMTQLIADELKIKKHHIVEASSSYARSLKQKFPQVSVEHNYLENFSSNQKFQTIIASHVLEHVKDTQQFLKSIKKFMTTSSTLLLSVPNALSIHRLLGVEMGMLNKPTQLNDQDKKIGHFRVYTPTSFEQDIKRSGLKIQTISTSFIKFLSNKQYEDMIDKKNWTYFEKISKHFPQNGADIYAICTK